MSETRPTRVLIVDDDPLANLCLRAQLSNLGHVVVGEAANGQEAVALARQLRPDLIVMDIKMPVMDGLEASERIEHDCLCPIILLSAYSDPEMIRRAHALPVQAYLIKPVTEQDLEPTIELALDRFSRIKSLLAEMDHLKAVMDVRSSLKQAVDYLIRHRNLSPREAREWVQQEARAKRAGLGEVAQAVLVDRTVPFHYDVPL